MFKHNCFLLLFISYCLQVNTATNSAINIAIIGLGGRAQTLLLECLRQNPAIHVVAICDDRAFECLEFQRNRLITWGDARLHAYQNAINNAALYSNTPEDLSKLFAEHPEIDKVLITSPNYDHNWHLTTILACCRDKNIFMEKPIFRTVDEFVNFDFEQTKDKNIIIGLTLRYSSMAAIVAQQLQEHKDKLGNLQHVKVWERLNFRHAFVAFVMGWRRYIRLSGGLLLEKSIHDLDLALFFMTTYGVDPHTIVMNTETAHRFFITSRIDELLSYIPHNEDVCKRAEQLNYRSWEPGNIIRDENGAIHWKKSLDSILAEYPENNDFKNITIIPDYHKLSATMMTTEGNSIKFDLEVDLGGFRKTTERGQFFTFANGTVLIDVMASIMRICYIDGAVFEYNLHTNNTDHADGDEFIVKTILAHGVYQECHTATLNDSIVMLANFMGLVSEEQALHGPEYVVLEKVDQNWIRSQADKTLFL